MNVWFRFLLAVLATWRVTHLLASEDGPGDLIVDLRVKLGQSWVGKLLDCFYCLSLWMAAPAALFVARDPVEWIFAWLATSGGACLLERPFKEKEAVMIEPMPVTAQGDVNVLRTESRAAQSFPGASTEPLAAHAAASSASQ